MRRKEKKHRKKGNLKIDKGVGIDGWVWPGGLVDNGTRDTTALLYEDYPVYGKKNTYAGPRYAAW
jgi:hypothetical protein